MAVANKSLIAPESLWNVLDYNPATGVLTWRKRDEASNWVWKAWNTRWAGTEALAAVQTDGYLTGTIFGHRVLAHRVAWAMHYGEWPKVIDHINGNPSDNRIENLRNVSVTENNRNVKISHRNKTGFQGVRFVANRERWRATYAGKNLGSFGCITAAAIARKIEEVSRGHIVRRSATEAAKYERIHTILARGKR